MGVHDAAARGFARGASDYEKARPGYPQALVDKLVAELPVTSRTRLLDLAAGTGKFTRSLVPTGADIVAVEPVEPMRKQLRVVLPDVQVLDGTAEAIPLPDADVDAVTVAQGFHWFDPQVALAEMHRVLKPGGGLALIWNERDESVDWVQKFGDILVNHGGGRPYIRLDHRDVSEEVGDSALFTPVRSQQWDNPTPCGPEQLVARAGSTSFVSALDDAAREACLNEVRQLAAEHPDLRGRDAFDFPHIAVAYWCHRA